MKDTQRIFYLRIEKDGKSRALALDVDKLNQYLQRISQDEELTFDRLPREQNNYLPVAIQEWSGVAMPWEGYAAYDPETKEILILIQNVMRNLDDWTKPEFLVEDVLRTCYMHLYTVHNPDSSKMFLKHKKFGRMVELLLLLMTDLALIITGIIYHEIILAAVLTVIFTTLIVAWAKALEIVYDGLLNPITGGAPSFASDVISDPALSQIIRKSN